jgi:hypothetical protein
VVLGACRQGPAEPVTRDQYIDVMAALRKLDMEAATAAEFDQRRDSILSAAGVTDSMLVSFARRHARDLGSMAEIWDSIAMRLVVDDTIIR